MAGKVPNDGVWGVFEGSEIVMVFRSEIAALRRAVGMALEVRFLPYGVTGKELLEAGVEKFPLEAKPEEG